MLNLISKAGFKSCLKSGLVIPVLIIFALAGVNVVFAADGEDCGCNADKNYVQVSPETQIAKSANSRTKNDIDYIMNDIAGYVWSVISPDEALATVTTSWMDQCAKKSLDGSCCKSWKKGADEDKCIKIWSCIPQQKE